MLRFLPALISWCASVLFLVLIGVLWHPAASLNLPCSGNKGGVSHCDGDVFVCVNGTVSASKQSCSAYSASDRTISSSNRPGPTPAVESTSTQGKDAAGVEHTSATHMTRGSSSRATDSAATRATGKNAKAVTVLQGSPSPVNRSGNLNCPCTENSLCTGPRGGRFCITRAGKKRYPKRN